jgi:hypothetical protein
LVTLISLSGNVSLVLASSSGAASLPKSSPLEVPHEVTPDVPGVGQFCPVGLRTPAGIFNGPNGGAFVEDWMTGQLLWCASDRSETVIADPQSFEDGWYGMGGISTSIGLVLVLSHNASDGSQSFWMCLVASPTGCGILSRFITLPFSFCSNLPAGYCNPAGVAIDRKLNIYYADAVNGMVVKCSSGSSYQSCTILENLPGKPTGLFRDSSGNLWVSDESCSGKVWENGVLKFTVGDAVEGITISKLNPSKTPHVFVGVDGSCTKTAAHVLDLTDGKPLPTNLIQPDRIIGLIPKLIFDAWNKGIVYKTSDKA